MASKKNIEFLCSTTKRKQALKMDDIKLYPDCLMPKLWHKIRETSKTAFFSAFIIGFFCHFTGISKWGLFNWDQMFDRIALSDLWLGQGKWLSGAADYIVCDGYSSLSYSVVIGLISIAIFSAVLMVGQVEDIVILSAHALCPPIVPFRSRAVAPSSRECTLRMAFFPYLPLKDRMASCIHRSRSRSADSSACRCSKVE